MTGDPAPPRSGAVSVVIPTHRDRGFLLEAIASVLPQLESGDEILVVANGCSAAYLTFLQEQQGPALRVVVSGAGVATARNAGVLSALGEFVLLLDDDDVLLPAALTTLRGILRDDVTAVAACGGVALWRAASADIVDTVVMPPTPLAHHALLAGPPSVSMGAAIFRRRALIAVGLLDQRLAPADDKDLWLKVGRIGPLKTSPVVALRYRFHDGNESRKAAVIALAALRVFDLHYALTPARELPYVPRAVRKLVGWHAGQLYRSAKDHVLAGEWGPAFTNLRVIMQVRVFEMRLAIQNTWRRVLHRDDGRSTP